MAMGGYIDSLRLQYEDSVANHADPRVKDWLLLNRSPKYVLCLSFLYLAFIYFGRKVMRDRAPLSLRGFMVIYNFGVVLLSVYIVLEIVLSAAALNYNYVCQPYNKNTWKDPGELRMAKALWWYFFSKAIEFTDTVLMVLRKKDGQITFLHVFHHVSMLNIWWWVMMFIPGGQSHFASSLNSLVHVVMYSYYGLNLFPSVRKHLWWKRYITQFQLLQFAVVLVHTLYTHFGGCDFPTWAVVLLSSYMVLMMVLFGNFYIHAYRGRKNLVRSSHSNGAVAQYSECTPSTNGIKKGV